MTTWYLTWNNRNLLPGYKLRLNHCQCSQNKANWIHLAKSLMSIISTSQLLHVSSIRWKESKRNGNLSWIEIEVATEDSTRVDIASELRVIWFFPLNRVEKFFLLLFASSSIWKIILADLKWLNFTLNLREVSFTFKKHLLSETTGLKRIFLFNAILWILRNTTGIKNSYPKRSWKFGTEFFPRIVLFIIQVLSIFILDWPTVFPWHLGPPSS